MGKRKIPYVLSLICMLLAMGNIVFADGPRMPEDNEVAIHYSGVEVPLNRIVLVRKDDHYCAIKFIDCWTGVDEKRMKEYAPYINREGEIANEFKTSALQKHSIYESFYQDDGTGDFSNKNVKVIQGSASWLPLRGPFRPFIYQPGDSFVKCGPYKLGWQYKAFISVIPKGKEMGEYGFEVAPTPWTDTKQVNIHDPRIKWYRYDEKRERTYIPIDKLLETPVQK